MTTMVWSSSAKSFCQHYHYGKAEPLSEQVQTTPSLCCSAGVSNIISWKLLPKIEMKMALSLLHFIQKKRNKIVNKLFYRNACCFTFCQTPFSPSAVFVALQIYWNFKTDLFIAWTYWNRHLLLKDCTHCPYHMEANLC